VKLSVKSDYAVRAVFGLARAFRTRDVCRVDDLAAEQGVPANYLVQILIELKSTHLVKSVRGKEGGYLLARPPAEITLGDVLRAIHGDIFESPALTDTQCPPPLRQAWEKLQSAVTRTANAINFQDLIEDADRSKMYYI
jgi:Rrf2 family protein